MTAWLLKLLKYLPGLGSILEKLSPESTRLEELRAQTEHEDIAGFHRTGRISAAHLWKYAKVILAFILAICFCAMLFYPNLAINASTALDGFVEAVMKLFSVGM